jgi:hypothetical protein
MPQKAGGTRIAGMRLLFAHSGEGVRAVPGATDQTIALRPSAVFQLLLFAASDEVRHAAADLLEPAIAVPAERVRLLVGDIAAMPRWEQVAARLVATAIDRSPSNAERYNGLYPAWGSFQARGAGVLVYETARQDFASMRIERIAEVFTWRRFAFALPKSVEDMTTRLRAATSHCDPGTGRAKALWSLHEGAFGVALPCAPRAFRGTKHWRPVRLYSPDGVLVHQSQPTGVRSSPLAGFEIDSGMLLRLEAGGLAGHVIECMFEDPYPRSDRARHCVISVECGASLSDRPIAITLVGELEPRYPIDAIAGKPRLPMPLLGGATIESLDLIARRVGVWHGESLRGSFVHHPLRTLARKEVA